MNPFRSARVVADNVSVETYRRQEPGIKRGDANWVMSRGELMELLWCPARWKEGVPDGRSKSTDFGNLVDVLALQPQKFESLYAVCPEEYPSKDGPKAWNRNATFVKEWEAKARKEGRECIDADDLTYAKAAWSKLLADHDIKELLYTSRKQVMVIGEYYDRDTGLSVPVRALIDLVPNVYHPRFCKSLADLKTCRSAHPRAWDKAVAEDDLHVQGAAYLDLYCAATGEDRCEFRHVLVENQPPWQTGKRWLTSETLEAGRLKYLTALKLYCRCLASNHWPSYDPSGDMAIDGWSRTEVPVWALTQVFDLPHFPTKKESLPAFIEPEDVLP